MSQGFGRLEEFLRGMLAPGLRLVAARFGGGATAAAMQLIELRLREAPRPVAVFSPNQFRGDIVRRLIALRAPARLESLYRDPIPQRYQEAAARAAAELSPWLFVDETPRVTPALIARRAGTLQRKLKAAGSGLGLLAIDALRGFIRPRDRHYVDWLTRTLLGLRALSARLSCPVLLVCELRLRDRSGGASEHEPPWLEHLPLGAAGPLAAIPDSLLLVNRTPCPVRRLSDGDAELVRVVRGGREALAARFDEQVCRFVDLDPVFAGGTEEAEVVFS